MSGHIARKGFLFQDNYLLFRVLEDVSNSLECAWKVGSHNVLDAIRHSPVQFGIEAPVLTDDSVDTDAAGCDWDVLVLGESKLEFAEVKSGTVNKSDRITFWRRLRGEITRNLHAPTIFVPVLVVDPSKLDAPGKWHTLAQGAAAFSGSPPAKEPDGNVLTGNDLLAEAMWWMCRPDNTPEGSDPPVEFTTAIKALSRFELHCHEAQKLESQVLQFVELLFPGGLTESQQMLLLGWLNKRATSCDEARRLFSIRELLQEIGILQDAISLAPGTLKEWRTLWNEAPLAVRARTRLCLGQNGASVPAALVQPSALNALDPNDSRALIILAPGGSGKSTFVAQIAQAPGLSDDVMHCGADDVSPHELEQLTRAIRFSAALAAMRRPGTQLLVCIDGLDEADPPLRKRWAQLLVRLASLPNVRILVSMRDATWRIDGDVRKELESWQTIALNLWPEPLVRELVAPTPYSALPTAVITLLRTPILLDLFWRTFVESSTPHISLASRLQTRHSLLAAFWHERLVMSPRHAAFSDIISRINGVVSRGAQNVGAFAEANLEAIAVQTLLSEGVLVREGRLQPRLRFRHPLLRDFALAQWCLESNDASKLSRRLNSIQGGLQRHGALRAIFEALSDQDASTEYPRMNLGNVVQEIVVSDPGQASQLAHVLGTREPIPPLDPASWPPSVQSSLPAEFGRDLLSGARLDGNSAWSAPLEKWPDDARWLNNDYAREVWVYANYLSERLHAKPDDADLREHCHQAARKLRSISEAPHFAREFGESERWLKMQAMLCVIPMLPDHATLEWVEREMPQSTWRTRSFVLEKLIHLARIDAPRTAMIYRQAVGLTYQSGRPVIEASRWFETMDHQAIEWSLAGENGKRSLLKEYTAAFLPLAIDLAEALWTLKHQDPRSRENRMSDLLQKIDPSCSGEAQLQYERERLLRLGDLIDDSPVWRCWHSLPTGDPYVRCLKAVHECAEHCVKQSPALLAPIAKMLRSSRMASLHMTLFGVVLENHHSSSAIDILLECILDPRLYHVSGLEYWIEQGLVAVWPNLFESDRLRVFGLLRNLLAIEESEEDAKHFLARLPVADLPDDLRPFRPADDDASYQARNRSTRAAFDLHSEPAAIEPDACEIEIGEWPEDFNHETVKDFSRATGPLSKQETPIEQLREIVPIAIEKAQALIPALRLHVNLLEDSSRFWVWQRFAQMLACFRRIQEPEERRPDWDVVLGCAELALARLENIPSELPGHLPEGDVWISYRETSWGHALRLADEVFTWPPVADDQELQSRFIEVIKAAFATENPMIQLVCATTIRPFHWFLNNERRQLHFELVWEKPKHGSVLGWSLSSARYHSDTDRAKIFRLLLTRSGLIDPSHLSGSLGKHIGVGSMQVFIDGQRSVVAEIARDAITSPNSLPLLRDASNRSEFLRGLIFGMKEQARLVSSLYPQLAADYGDWSLSVWRIMRAQRKKRNESEGVILFAMHCFEKQDGQADRTHLKLWWQHLQPLFAAVIHEGGRPDCFTLLFQLRGGEYNDLTTPEEMFRLLEAFISRIRTGALAGSMDLDEREPANEEHHSWRECAGYVAEAIDSLRSDGSLRTDQHLEEAHRLQSILAAEPIRSSRAVAGLHHLQSG